MEIVMKRKLCKILLSVLGYVVFTTLFTMQLLLCSAHIGEHTPPPFPAFHPSYAVLMEYSTY